MNPNKTYFPLLLLSLATSFSPSSLAQESVYLLQEDTGPRILNATTLDTSHFVSIAAPNVQLPRPGSNEFLYGGNGYIAAYNTTTGVISRTLLINADISAMTIANNTTLYAAGFNQSIGGMIFEIPFSTFSVARSSAVSSVSCTFGDSSAVLIEDLVYVTETNEIYLVVTYDGLRIDPIVYSRQTLQEVFCYDLLANGFGDAVEIEKNPNSAVIYINDGGDLSGTIYAINALNRTVVGQFPTTTSIRVLSMPKDLLISPDGSRLYAFSTSLLDTTSPFRSGRNTTFPGIVAIDTADGAIADIIFGTHENYALNVSGNLLFTITSAEEPPLSGNIVPGVARINLAQNSIQEAFKAYSTPRDLKIFQTPAAPGLNFVFSSSFE